MKRPGEEPDPPAGKADRRRRQFEDERGLAGRPLLPLEPEPEPSPEDEAERDAGEDAP